MKFITLYHLRMIALIEGISYLLLLFIGMPLKYGLNIMIVNKVLGMGHGVLTLIFCTALYILWQQKKINSQLSIGVFIASLIPFGAFVADSKLVKLTQSS
ncbi:hypothetical protein DID78_01725 [Candidatus Marinamargulisbacteria bacterium SCGC AG-343-D04]|nr:hypothetical protein DID78_01725 [Candidatus Marinamargulisbacteria bacterium SCGC AG-343-D04]